MPPHHRPHPDDDFGPPDHFLFDTPELERLMAAAGARPGRMAHRLLQRRGAPPEHFIEIELLLALFDRLYKLERQLAEVLRERPTGELSDADL